MVWPGSLKLRRFASGPAAAMAPAASMAPAEGMAVRVQPRRARAAMPAGAILVAVPIAAAGPDSKAAATIAAAGYSDGNETIHRDF